MSLPAYDALLADHSGVATRTQLGGAGLSASSVQAQIDGGRWQALNEHVVVTHNGPLTRDQRRWAVDLSTPGLHAMCSLTALEMWGVVGFEVDEVHVLVPRGGHVLPVPFDVIIHESRRFTAEHVSHGRSPQLTSLARSTVDAAAWAKDLWAGFRIFVAPVQQRRARAAGLRRELLRAGRVRHRRQLIALADDLCGGAEALSEVEFLRFCRRHGLPKPECQRRMDSAGRWRYLDATFRRPDGTLLRVEIDGGVHLSLTVRSRDTIKDNAASLAGRLVLRYASAAIYADDPQAVAQIRQGLRSVSG